MTLTTIALMLPEPVLLICGLSLLNWVFRPPYSDVFDFFLMMTAFAIMFFFASWGVALSYGVEII